MNDIQIFNNEEFGAVRTTGTPEQPLFCLADVARVLGLKTSKLVQRLSDDVLSKYPISDSLGREQVTNFIGTYITCFVSLNRAPFLSIKHYEQVTI